MISINIKYFGEQKKIEKIPCGDWIDLRAAKDVSLNKDEFCFIPLGIGMQLPPGYEAHVLPRSSTFKKWGILMTNSMGIIDNSYCGDDDQWMFPALATRPVEINKGDRIAQFRIMPKQPEICFEIVEFLESENRGGFGSTGHN